MARVRTTALGLGLGLGLALALLGLLGLPGLSLGWLAPTRAFRLPTGRGRPLFPATRRMAEEASSSSSSSLVRRLVADQPLPSRPASSSPEPTAVAKDASSSADFLKVLARFENQPVSAYEMSSLTGKDLRFAQNELFRLALLSQAELEAREGRIYYVFPSQLQRKILQKSWTERLRRLGAALLPSFMVVVKWFVGLSLMAFFALSMVLIASLAAAPMRHGGSFQTSQRKRDDDKDKDKDKNNGFGGRSRNQRIRSPSSGMHFSIDLGHLFYTLDALVTNRPNSFSSSAAGMRPPLIDVVFSYLFGDGTPGPDPAETQLKLASAVIRRNGGTVRASDLAPFLDSPRRPRDSWPGSGESLLVDESWLLPVVEKLQGFPSVDADGVIRYTFEGLEAPLSSELAEPLPTHFEQPLLQFSRFSVGRLFVPFVLGVVLMLAIFFQAQLLAQTLPFLSAIHRKDVILMFRFLSLYGALFNALPLLRFWYISASNAKIEAANANRRSWIARASFGG